MSDFSVTGCGLMTTVPVDEAEAEMPDPPLEVEALRTRPPPPHCAESEADIMASEGESEGRVAVLGKEARSLSAKKENYISRAHSN